ncbi:hypothetical protein [Metabacillus niabensis]
MAYLHKVETPYYFSGWKTWIIKIMIRGNNMLDTSLVKSLIIERSKLHMNDPKVYEYWGKLTELLSRNVEDTINYLNHCSEEEIYWLSEIFEDISAKVNCQKYIECLKKLDKKYSNLNLSMDIKVAEEWMEG